MVPFNHLLFCFVLWSKMSSAFRKCLRLHYFQFLLLILFKMFKISTYPFITLFLVAVSFCSLKHLKYPGNVSNSEQPQCQNFHSWLIFCFQKYINFHEILSYPRHVDQNFKVSKSYSQCGHNLTVRQFLQSPGHQIQHLSRLHSFMSLCWL